MTDEQGLSVEHWFVHGEDGHRYGPFSTDDDASECEHALESETERLFWTQRGT